MATGIKLLIGIFLIGTTWSEEAQSTGNLLQYRPGDVIIVGLFPVHSRGNEECSKIQEYGFQLVETMNMVIDDINSNENILPGIKLGTIMVDTCDSDAHALRRIVIDVLPLMLNTSIGVLSTKLKAQRPDIPPSLVAGVIGAASSAISMQVASLLQAFKVPQISYWSTSPLLSDKIRYEYFFRMVPSDINQAKAMVTLLKQMDWNYVSVVYEGDFYGESGYKAVKDFAEDQNICIAALESVPRSPTDEDFSRIIQSLVESNAKAVILFMKSVDASRLIKASEEFGDRAKEFIWIGSDAWSTVIPLEDHIFNDSTLDGAVGFNPMTRMLNGFEDYVLDLTLEENRKTFRNPWFSEMLEEKNKCSVKNGSSYGRKCGVTEKIEPGSLHVLSIMENLADSVLAFANALHRYYEEKCGGTGGLCEVMSRHRGTTGLAKELFPILKNITFENYSNRTMKFDENQDGPAVYDIYSFNNSKKVGNGSSLKKWQRAGFYKNGMIELEDLGSKVSTTESVCSKPCEAGQAKITETNTCCWHCETCAAYEYVSNNGTVCTKCDKGFRPNRNRTGCVPLEITEMSYSNTYGIICAVVGSVGMFFTLIVTVIFIMYRKTAIVMASGSELCFFILFGMFLTYVNFFAYAAPPSVGSCAMSRIILALGPAWIYGGLLIKTLRVVIVFRSKYALSAKVKMFLRPLSQILVSLALVIIQAIVLAAWFAVSPPLVEVYHPEDDVAYRACSQLIDLPILVGLIYPFMLIIICTVLATVNRNIPTGYKETRFIGFSMYTTCVIWLAFLPIFITSTTDLSLRKMTTSVCLSLSAFTVLICLFGQRCFKILFRPEENTRKSVMLSSVSKANKEKSDPSSSPSRAG